MHNQLVEFIAAGNQTISILAGNCEIIPLFIAITWKKKNNHTIVVDTIISNDTGQDPDRFSFRKVLFAAEKRQAAPP